MSNWRNGRQVGVRRLCTVDGCEKQREAYGLCVKHYRRFQTHGDTAVVLRGGGARGRGPDHALWVGESASYDTVHARLRRERGPASEHTCACGKPAQHWAFDEHTGFSTDLSRYTPMCASCHKLTDNALAAADMPLGHVI